MSLLDINTQLCKLCQTMSLFRFHFRCNIVIPFMVMGRMDYVPILPRKCSVTTSTMKNLNGDGHSEGDGVGTCKQTLKAHSHFTTATSPNSFHANAYWCPCNPFQNKKVLLHECKRHTAHCVASTCYAVLVGGGGGTYPRQGGTYPRQGVPTLGGRYLPR